MSDRTYEEYLTITKSVFESRISGTAKLTYIALLGYCYGNKKHCWPGQNTIAKTLNKSRSTIHRAIKELEAAKLVSIERRNASGMTNIYYLYSLPSYKRKNSKKNSMEHGEPVGHMVLVDDTGGVSCGEEGGCHVEKGGGVTEATRSNLKESHERKHIKISLRERDSKARPVNHRNTGHTETTENSENTQSQESGENLAPTVDAPVTQPSVLKAAWDKIARKETKKPKKTSVDFSKITRIVSNSGAREINVMEWSQHNFESFLQYSHDYVWPTIKQAAFTPKDHKLLKNLIRELGNVRTKKLIEFTISKFNDLRDKFGWTSGWLNIPLLYSFRSSLCGLMQSDWSPELVVSRKNRYKG